MTKRFFSFILVISILASSVVALPVTASADTYGIYTYTVSDEEVTITDCSYDEDGVIEIPSTIDDYPVTAIGDYAFSDCTGLTGVIFPAYITTIGDYAFYQCENLTEIILPNRIGTIGNSAFGKCQNLTDVYYEGRQTSWDSISIGEDNNALVNADKTFEYDYYYIDAWFEKLTFTGSAVEGILGFENLRRACVAVFEIRNYKGALEKTLEIQIPIGTEEKAFSIPFEADDEEHEIAVTFINNSTDRIKIEGEAWDYFYAEIGRFTDGDWQYTVDNEKAVIFNYLGESREIEIPAVLGGYAVSSIADYAFEESVYENDVCITSLTLPYSLESISDWAFNELYDLQTIDISAENQYFCIVDNVLFDKGKTTLIKYPAEKRGSQYSIPDTVKTISADAFAFNDYLKEIYIPNGVTTIKESAFYGTACETITIPSSVTYIGLNAFKGIPLTEINVDTANANYASERGVLYNKAKTNLIKYPEGKQAPVIVVPNGVETISDYAFILHDIDTIVFPASLSYIEDRAFYRCGLQQVLYYGSEDDWAYVSFNTWNDPFYEAEFVFDYNPTGIFPYLDGQKYKNELLTLDISFISNDTDSVAVINIYEDEYVQKTLNQNVPAGTKTKSFEVPFEYDDMWHEVEILFVDNLTDNNELCHALYTEFRAEREKHTDGDWEYILDDGEAFVVNYIGESTVVEIPAVLGGYTVVGLSDDVFWYASQENYVYITSLTLPDSLETLSEWSLEGLFDLKSFNISPSNGHFSALDGVLFNKDKTKLIKYPSEKPGTTYTIPNTVKVVSFEAFERNENLTEIILPDGLTDIENYAFYNCDIEAITIPSSVTSIGEGAFSYCENLTEIIVNANNENFTSTDGVLFNKDKTTLLQYPYGKTSTTYAIPDGVKVIASQAMNNSYMEEITLPKSVVIIEDAAFEDCYRLNDVIYSCAYYEFSEINIMPGNHSLTNAPNITFRPSEMKANIKSVHSYYDNNKVTSIINFNHLEQAGTLHLAFYDRESLVNMISKIVALDEMENTVEIPHADEKYKDYDIKVFFWGGTSLVEPLAKAVETEVTEAEIIDYVLESEHPYGEDTDETKTYVYDGECVSIDVTFSEDTETEDGWDYIYIYDGKGRLVGKYTGLELAGQTIRVFGNTVKIQLTSDGSVTRNGYRTESIVVNK